MKNKWKNERLSNKIVTIVSLLASVAVVILAMLQLFNVWNKAGDVYIPLSGVTMLCQAYIQWNTSRKVAYISLGAAALIFICAIIVFFL